MEDDLLYWYDKQCQMMHVLRSHFTYAVELWSRNKNNIELKDIVFRYQDLCHNLMKIVGENGYNVETFIRDSQYV